MSLQAARDEKSCKGFPCSRLHPIAIQHQLAQMLRKSAPHLRRCLQKRRPAVCLEATGVVTESAGPLSAPAQAVRAASTAAQLIMQVTLASRCHSPEALVRGPVVRQCLSSRRHELCVCTDLSTQTVCLHCRQHGRQHAHLPAAAQQSGGQPSPARFTARAVSGKPARWGKRLQLKRPARQAPLLQSRRPRLHRASRAPAVRLWTRRASPTAWKARSRRNCRQRLLQRTKRCGCAFFCVCKYFTQHRLR